MKWPKWPCCCAGKRAVFSSGSKQEGKRYNVNIYRILSTCSLLILVTHTHASGWLIVLCTRPSLPLHLRTRHSSTGAGGVEAGKVTVGSVRPPLRYWGRNILITHHPELQSHPLSEQHLDSILKKRKKIQRRFKWKKLGVVSE